MENYINRTKFEISTGKKVDGRLLYSKAQGYALQFEGSPYFVVRLWIFEKELYLVRTRDDEMRYTVFAKKVQEGEQVRFQSPVGKGRITEELKSHLEIYLELLSKPIFMNLFPSE